MTAANTPPFDAHALLEEIRSWVVIESPTTDPAAVNRMVDRVEADARTAQAVIKRVPGHDGYGDHLLVSSPWGGEDEPGILVLSHLDTVHAVGTLAGPLPFRVEGDIAFGPGICDMKGGALIAFAALRHLIASARTTLPIRHLFVSDEEAGSHTSREIIEREAKRARYVLVTEPAREGGKVVTARKGTARFGIKVTGRSAHSGTRHQDGRNAIRELARQILILEDMTDHASGVTVNVGVINGGTRANVVAEHAFAEVDMRVPNPEIGDKAIARVLALKAHDPDTVVEITGGLNRPGYEKSAQIEGLFEHAKELAARIGFALADLKTGGGSDGNFTAHLAPTLDGLGVDGQGAHTHHEQIYVSSLVPRAMLMLRLMETLR